MTEDTKRALEIIEPIANAMKVQVSADKSFLYCNGQAIGIECNSTYATINEFIGYLFLKVWTKDKCFKIPPAVTERVQRYWFSPEQVELIKKMEGI